MGVVSGRDRLRRVLLVLGVIVTVFGMLHHVDHVDHVVRGNHSGWPFQDQQAERKRRHRIYALLLPGIYVNLRGRVAAGWWVFTAAALALVTFVHFLGGGEREAPIRDIYAVYGSPVAGLVALVVLAGLLAGLSALLISSLGALRRRT